MKVLSALALTLSALSASAFTPAKKAVVDVSLDACISKAEVLKSPDTTEFGKIWDPLGLADIGSDETLAWFRHSEVKHSRIAMAAVSLSYRVEVSCRRQKC